MENIQYAVVGKDIEKKFKSFELNIPELQIPKGFATALIGENGAGKSTLLNLMTGIRLDYKGEIRFFDEKETVMNDSIKERIGYTGPNGFFLPHWTVKQVAEVCKLLFQTFDENKFQDFCQELNIPEGSKGVTALSDGNRMKLTMATAFCRDTDILIMDEPASPLDPLMRDKLCELIRRYLADGNGEKSVFFSTHNIADMENVTDYAIIMDNGRIVEQGFVEELKEKYILVKGDSIENTELEKLFLGLNKTKVGFEGMLLASDLDKLAGMDVTCESPNLSQISIAIMKKYSKIR